MSWRNNRRLCSVRESYWTRDNPQVEERQASLARLVVNKKPISERLSYDMLIQESTKTRQRFGAAPVDLRYQGQVQAQTH